MRRVRRGALGASAVALALLPASALSVEGNLYEVGPGPWAVNGQFAATVLGGPVWQVGAPRLDPAAAGNVWEMGWGCPVAGSEIAAVQWGGLRTQAASSLEIRVTGNRERIWGEPDSAMPQSPAPGRAYHVALPGGHCNVHLALTQVEGRTQHQRTYFIDRPRIFLRDTAPPSVAFRSVPAGWVGRGPVTMAWGASDNFGSDGIRGQRIDVAGATRWAGAPGAGEHAAGVDLSGVPDGAHTVTLVAEGDGTAGAAASATVHVDGTPPELSGLSAALGDPGVATVAWAATDRLSGIASSQAEVNAAQDGSATGPWRPLGPGAAGPGRHEARGAFAEGLEDGVHAWRVRAADGAGNVAAAAGPAPLVVDTTPPSVELHSAPSGWVRAAELDFTATDNLQATLGLGQVELDVNTAADGGEGGDWQRRGTVPGAPGRRLQRVDLSGLEDGRHLVRVVVRNGGPFGQSLATERRATVRVDVTPPVVSRATFIADEPSLLRVAWVAEDARAGVSAATVQWRDGSQWRTLATEPAGNGAGSMAVDVSALPDGQRAVRLVIADAAGNLAARAGTGQLGGGLGSAASDPFRRLRTATLSLSAPGARAGHRGRRTVLTRRVGAGARLPIAGRLRDRGGRPIVGAQIEVRGHRGRRIGGALTRRDGRFALIARPVAGGRLRIGVPAGKGLLGRTSADVVVEVRPRVSLSASSTLAAAGEQVLFSGRLVPAPAELGLGSRKGVVLEWLDPVRRTWRPVVNARLSRDGMFAIPWTFGLRGLTIPMRVRVPEEVGWPLLPVRSRVIPVTLR